MNTLLVFINTSVEWRYAKKEGVQKVCKSTTRVTPVPSARDQGLIIRKMRSRNKFGMTLFQTF